ncbi:ATP-binding protein [Vibrio sp. Of7-15]|uniref:ATP-binding protein n=1 Tax=Vibrio sp. Of7-15 TaxID=2724879 RepID=UPI001EF3402B|nr:ATP-binding protein [Vibrio sp. Of7-15]MCG7499325.1 ATP-binding protein [Vibrio sp. Of7-15]
MLMPQFPFCAVSGQQPFKLALILAAINPAIGGVLVAGPRGSAKSTLARGLADILPNADARFVTLPLAATEEMVVGTLDLQQVLSDGNVNFTPGLLAKAHHGVLYVDEVNLLADSLVDLLLDVSTSGVNHVERDGISHQHEALFLLLGTMNPDEGEVRSQLLDRFGLFVNLTNHYSIEERMDIVKLREEFETDPQGFLQQYHQQQQQLQASIVQARNGLSSVTCPDELRRMIAERCFAANVDGLRADLVWYRAALAHAAWQQRAEVSQQDVLAVEELVLHHRRQTPPPPTKNDRPKPPPFRCPPPPEADSPSNDSNTNGDWGSMAPVEQKTAQNMKSVLLTSSSQKNTADLSQMLVSKKKAGQVIGGSKSSQLLTHKPDWFATLVSSLGQWPPARLCYQKAKTGQPVLHLVLLDTSASTLKKMQFSQAKAVVLQVAERAYVAREQICIFGFGNQEVKKLLPQQKAPKRILHWLDSITAAGGTPLQEVLAQARSYQQQLLKKMPSYVMQNYLITDGRVSSFDTGGKLHGETVLIDVEDSTVKRGRGKQIAQALDAEYIALLA